jgi:pentatricopeptide repeat protein
MVLLIDLYLNHNMLVEAKEIYQELKNKNSDFILDKYKVIKLTEAIAQTESIESEHFTLF